MKRGVALAAVVAVALVGLRAAGLTRANASGLGAGDLHGILAQVQERFGDKRLVSARIDGSTLDVAFRKTNEAGRDKSEFEAYVLAAAVADSMREHLQKPIERVAARRDGFAFSRWTPGEDVPSPAGPSLSLDTCTSAARASIRDYWSNAKLTSVEWLPYLHGTCVIRLRNASGYPVGAVPQAGLDVAQHIVSRFGVSNQFSARMFFEVDNPHGRPLFEIGLLPRYTFDYWLKRGLPLPYSWQPGQPIAVGGGAIHPPAHG